MTRHLRNKIALCVLFLLILLMPFSAASANAIIRLSQNERNIDIKALLSTLGICPYPEKGELKDSILNPKWIQGRTLSEDDINADFSNLDDLKWLKPIAKRNKVILFGKMQRIISKCLTRRLSFSDPPSFMSRCKRIIFK